MTAYRIEFAKSAARELRSLDAPLVRRIVERIEALASDPHPHGCKKLEGSDDAWRIRIGDYRVIYQVDDSKRLIDVSAIRHRRDAYR